MNLSSKIYVAGHQGMVGSAIVRNLTGKGYANLVLRTHADLDLTDQQAVERFFEKEEPEFVFLAAARVGGIVANNTYRTQFIYENLMIQNNIIHQSYMHRVTKLLFLGSSCIYPKFAPNPIKEEYLLTGLLEYTNEPYAIAKIAGIKMCEAYHEQYGCNFIPVMPTNLYGPNDNYHLENSHVMPALIRKIYLARCLENNDINAIINDFNHRPPTADRRLPTLDDIPAVLSNFGIRKESNGGVVLSLWGTGSPRREFLHVDDLAEAVVFVMATLNAGDIRTVITDASGSTEAVCSHINIGSGTDIPISDLAGMVKEIIGFKGALRFDPSKPDGTPRKLMDVSKLFDLGWRPRIDLEQGIRKVYEAYNG